MEMLIPSIPLCAHLIYKITEYALCGLERENQTLKQRQTNYWVLYSQKCYASFTSTEYSPMHGSWKKLLIPIMIVFSKQRVKMEFLWLK